MLAVTFLGEVVEEQENKRRTGMLVVKRQQWKM